MIKKLSKKRMFEILQIGNRNDPASSAMDIVIVVNIFVNIICMFLDTFDELLPYHNIIYVIETITIIFFCIEYVLRIWTAEYLYPDLTPGRARLKFLYSFDGIVDLLTILPFFFLTGFVVFRMLRVVRIFHLFRINSQYDSFNVITQVLKDKKNQIISSIFILLILIFASSLCMYSAEHDAQPEAFKNAFSGIWWSVSAVLTVGYGDIYPVTTLGQIMAIIIAFLGVGVVAIPTGIISAGFVEQYTKIKNVEDLSSKRGVQFITVKVGGHHNLLGKTVATANIPNGISLMTIIRSGSPLPVTGATEILAGDELVFAGANYADELGIVLQEERVTENHPWANKAVMDLDISRLTTLVSIDRGHKTIIPNGKTIIKPGDIVVMYSRAPKK